MQVTSALAILIAVTGAFAAPGTSYKEPEHHHPHKPHKPAPPPPSVQQITCSSGAPYCCTAEANGSQKSDGGKLSFSCAALSGTCNSIAVCCNNNNGDQTCTGLNGASVWIKDSKNTNTHKGH
ncbi:hypothetical protein BGZ63DRAFT_176162 [Mariannaea sp. PMI_226]|nr:hypothetical protein BGZ63DRAFT_176162 [Mariannaea sp. PMI_226]